MSSETMKRTPKGEGETVSVTLHLPKELYNRIKEEADDEDRDLRRHLIRYINGAFSADDAEV